MPKTQIRSLSPDDLEAISHIEHLIAGRPRRGFLEKRFAAMATTPEHFITSVAHELGRVVRYSFAHVQEGEFGSCGRVAVLDVLGVNPEDQGYGIGRLLLRHLQEQIHEQGVQVLKTQITWQDRKMVQFFSGAGFRLAPAQIIERDTAVLPESMEEAEPLGEGRTSSDDHHDLSRDLHPVRSLQAADLPEVIRIDHSLTGRDRTPYFAAKFEEMLTESGIRVSLVTEDAGVLTGFVMARVDFGEFGKVERTAVIDSIGVHPAFKGSGIGQALLSQLLLNLSSLQVEWVRTQVSPEDFRLHRFLHGCGFRQSQQLVLEMRMPLDQIARALAVPQAQAATIS
jgi:ribosomal protein S18 acetylase RimI-like enzyme